MDGQAIAAADEPFVATLRSGTFAAPEDGWGPELIAAHVAGNNELIAEAAERIIAGTPASYDNLEAWRMCRFRPLSIPGTVWATSPTRLKRRLGGWLTPGRRSVTAPAASSCRS
jgi:hypothetical protein